MQEKVLLLGKMFSRWDDRNVRIQYAIQSFIPVLFYWMYGFDSFCHFPRNVKFSFMLCWIIIASYMYFSDREKSDGLNHFDACY